MPMPSPQLPGDTKGDGPSIPGGGFPDFPPTTYTFHELEYETQYTFTVTAVNAVGSSQPVSTTMTTGAEPVFYDSLSIHFNRYQQTSQYSGITYNNPNVSSGSSIWVYDNQPVVFQEPTLNDPEFTFDGWYWHEYQMPNHVLIRRIKVEGSEDIRALVGTGNKSATIWANFRHISDDILPQRKITIASNLQNGTVHVSREWAIQGSMIWVQAAGHWMSSADGKHYRIVDGSIAVNGVPVATANGTWHHVYYYDAWFVMPDQDVVVSALFEEIPADRRLEIDPNIQDKGASIFGAMNFDNGIDWTPGHRFDVRIWPHGGRRVKALQLICKTTGNAVPTTFTREEPASRNWWFTMPDADVYITVETELIPRSYMSIANNVIGGQLIDTRAEPNEGLIPPADDGTGWQVAQIRAIPDAGYRLVYGSARYVTVTGLIVPITNIYFDGLEEYVLGIRTPSESFTVHAEFEPIIGTPTYHAVTVTNPTNPDPGSSFVSLQTPNLARAGQTVRLGFHLPWGGGSSSAYWRVTPGTVMVNDQPAEYCSELGYYFTMPAGAAHITYEAERTPAWFLEVDMTNPTQVYSTTTVGRFFDNTPNINVNMQILMAETDGNTGAFTLNVVSDCGDYTDELIRGYYITNGDAITFHIAAQSRGFVDTYKVIFAGVVQDDQLLIDFNDITLNFKDTFLNTTNAAQFHIDIKVATFEMPADDCGENLDS
jgi:hypothetical protein